MNRMVESITFPTADNTRSRTDHVERTRTDQNATHGSQGARKGIDNGIEMPEKRKEYDREFREGSRPLVSSE
jgi:hypothetical protein